MMRIAIIKALFLLGAGLTLFSSCSTDVPSTIPDGYLVNCTINLNDAQFSPLKTPGTALSVNVPFSYNTQLGYGGLIIVHALSPENTFYAFDSSCPYEKEQNIKVKVSQLEAICPQCGSKFDIVTGFGVPIAGPARNPLKRYNSVYFSKDMIRIVN